MKIEEKNSVLQLAAKDDGSGDLLVAIAVQSEGFSGHADGHIVGAAWRGFVRELATLEATRKGAACLVSAMPGEFDLQVKAIDSKGHMGVSGVLSYCRVGIDQSPVQQLRFAFEFDPSKLSAFVAAVANAQQSVKPDRREDAAPG